MTGSILKPVVSEKSMKAASLNWFTFLVSPSLTKDQIRKEVEREFGVNVRQIKTITIPGKTKLNAKTRRRSQSPNRKKAIVKLAEGQKIDFFDISDKSEPTT